MEINQNLSEKAIYDCKLVNLAVNGDQKSYAKLMDRYRDAIYFMLLKMVNNPIDAEDLTIEAFGKAFKNIGQYTPNYAFSTWLFKIATNNCIDYIRKKRGNLIFIDIEADGFLYNMVRNIVGTLVEVGREAQPESWPTQVLHGHNRSLAGPTAPPHGLFLLRVEY